MPAPSNILVIRFSSLGDLVLTTPIYRGLKAMWPGARLTLLTAEGYGDVLDHNPHIDRVIKHPRSEKLSELRALARRLAEGGFDLVYDAHRSLRSRFLTLFLTRAGARVWTVDKRGLRRDLLIHFKINTLRDAPPMRRAFLAPLEAELGRALDASTELFPSAEDHGRAEALLREGGLLGRPFAALGPSASFPLKAWPVAAFHELGEALAARGLGLALCGGPNEAETRELAGLLGPRALDLSGALSPLQSAALLSRARFAVCNDTSVGHLAEAVGTPATVLFGPTVAEFGYGPFLPDSRLIDQPLACRPCTRNGKGRCGLPVERLCLESVTPAMVLSALPPALLAP